MHLLDLVEHELRAFRETGRAVHLAHAARALDEVRSQLSRGPDKSLSEHVDGSRTSGQ